MDKEEREAVQSVIEAKQIEDVQKVNNYLVPEKIENMSTDHLQTEQIGTNRSRNETFPCDKCDQTFKVYLELEKHKLTVHKDNEPEKIPFLEQKMQENLNEIKIQVNKCDVCQKSCASQASLKKHKMLHVKCEVCDKTYYNSNSLKKHMIVHAT